MQVFRPALAKESQQRVELAIRQGRCVGEAWIIAVLAGEKCKRDGAFARKRRQPFDPVFAVWHALAAVPPNEFASKAPGMIKALSSDEQNKLNPLVANAFVSAGPTLVSLKEVAKVYGKLLADVDNAWRKTSKESPASAALPDAPMGVVLNH